MLLKGKVKKRQWRSSKNKSKGTHLWGSYFCTAISIPLPLENSFKQLPKLDFFPQIVSALVFPSTSLM